MGFESIIGAMISSDSASDAASAQAAGTAEANALQKKQYEETRRLLSPFVGTGTAANNKLAQLLGVGGTPGGVATVPQLTRDEIRAGLLDQYTTPGGWRTVDVGREETRNIQDPATVDEFSLNRAIERQLAEQMGKAGGVDSSAADYGSLLQNFTGADLVNEPGYKFGMQQGEQQIDRLNASRGSMLSGGALKALARFNKDYASTKFGDAFNRDAANKTRTFNFLSGTSGTGQNAAAMTGTAGQTMANQVGANTTANANAQGASSIAQGNAWNNAFQNIGDDYRQNNLLKTIMGGNQSWGSPTSSIGYGPR